VVITLCVLIIMIFIMIVLFGLAGPVGCPASLLATHSGGLALKPLGTSSLAGKALGSILALRWPCVVRQGRWLTSAHNCTTRGSKGKQLLWLCKPAM
jgi:hypothetical protein